jgi:hypothetical protein
LYEEVWTEPTQKVAQRYGVSDVAIAKACSLLDIPKPPRGYWARKAAGQQATGATDAAETRLRRYARRMHRLRSLKDFAANSRSTDVGRF